MPNYKTLAQRPLVWILGLFAASLAVGTFYDYGLSTAGDELPLISTAFKMLSDHTLRPDYVVFYHLALGVYLYLPFVALLLGFLLLFRVFPSVAALKQFALLDFFKFLPLARVITLGVSVASIYLTYKIAEKLFKQRAVALYASAFMATSLLFSYASHFGRVWPVQITAMLAALYLIVLFYERAENTWKNFAIVGLALGISFGVHFIGLFVYAPFLLVLWLRYGRQALVDGRFWLANGIIAAIAAFVFYLNPYGFTNYTRSIDFLFNPVSKTPAWYDYVPTPLGDKVTYYAHVLIGYDPILLVISLAGGYLLFRNNKKVFAIVGGFAVLYFVGISALGYVARYVAPIIPFLAMLAGYGFYEATKGLQPRFQKSLCVVLFGILCIPPVCLDAWMLRQSTRSEALSYVYAQVPAGKRVVMFDNFMPLNENKQTLEDAQAYTDDYTIKRSYLNSLDPALLPAPNYYVLTVPLFLRKSMPAALTGHYDYAVLAWWSESERNQQRAQLAQITKGEEAEPITRFGASSTPLDVANDAMSPIPYLLSGGQSGPTIEVVALHPKN